MVELCDGHGPDVSGRGCSFSSRSRRSWSSMSWSSLPRRAPPATVSCATTPKTTTPCRPQRQVLPTGPWSSHRPRAGASPDPAELRLFCRNAHDGLASATSYRQRHPHSPSLSRCRRSDGRSLRMHESRNDSFDHGRSRRRCHSSVRHVQDLRDIPDDTRFPSEPPSRRRNRRRRYGRCEEPSPSR